MLPLAADGYDALLQRSTPTSDVNTDAMQMTMMWMVSRTAMASQSEEAARGSTQQPPERSLTLLRLRNPHAPTSSRRLLVHEQ
jgi:hypothetical protein